MAAEQEHQSTHIVRSSPCSIETISLPCPASAAVLAALMARLDLHHETATAILIQRRLRRHHPSKAIQISGWVDTTTLAATSPRRECPWGDLRRLAAQVVAVERGS